MIIGVLALAKPSFADDEAVPPSHAFSEQKISSNSNQNSNSADTLSDTFSEHIPEIEANASPQTLTESIPKAEINLENPNNQQNSNNADNNTDKNAIDSAQIKKQKDIAQASTESTAAITENTQITEQIIHKDNALAQNALDKKEKKSNNKPTIATNDISWLELMEALAQFGDKKKLDKYIQAYYQDNPDVANGKYPHLFYDAAITGSINFLQYLITYYPDRLFVSYQNGPTVLGYIAGDNQLTIARLLLKAGLNPNDTGNTEADYPLSLAINSGNLQMIKLLLEYGANVHIGQAYHSPLGLLLDNNDLETLKVIDTYDFTLDPLDSELRQLIIAYLNAELVEEEMLSILVQHGFDPRLYTSDQPSFLEVAKTQVKSPDVLAMLADVSLAYDLTEQTRQQAEQPKPPQSDSSPTTQQQLSSADDEQGQ